jgi:putative oxidoreductase
MKYVPLAGRILFSIHFLLAAPLHFTSTDIGYATQSGVPMANILVPLSGIMALLGGLGVLLGYKAKWAGWLLFLFLIPVNFMMHPFWSITDPMQKQMMMAFFLKDLSMTGAALLIAYFGAGPVSLDEMLAKRKVAL